MSYALVKAGTAVQAANPAYGQATAAGNLAICWLFTNNSSATFADSIVGTGWTQVPNPGGGAFSWTSIWYKTNIGAGETAPTVSTGGSSWWVKLAEYSGGATSSPLDSSGGNGGTGGSTQTATNGASDAAAGSLIISCSGWNGGNSGTVSSTTMADSSGAAVTPTVDSGPSSGFQYDFAWGIAGPTGAQKDTATAVLSVFDNGSGAIASFKVAPSAGVGGTAQPRATVPVPRRRPARAIWARITGQAYIAVPAPRQEYQLAPRRRPARAVWRGGAGQAYVSVPAPVQQFRTAPRRKLARAYVQFIPVTTTNAAGGAGVAGTVPALMASQTRVAVRRDGRVVRQ